MKVFYFIAWLIRKLTNTISQSQENLKERFRYRPIEAVFICIITSVLAFIVLMFPILAYADTWSELTNLVAGYWIAAGCYFVYMVLATLYDKFVEEQEEFINTLKR
jgi:hypothetical protein